MLTLIYLQAERVRSVFAQTSEMMLTKQVQEHSGGGEAGLEAGVFGLKATGKGSRTSKTITESALTSEQMLSKLLAQVPETSVTVFVEGKGGWDTVEPGSLLLLAGTFSLECYGSTREELWKSFCANPAEKLVRNDLYLRGNVAERDVEIAFRSEWFTGPNALPFLCRPTLLTLEVLALAFALPDDGPAMLQPVAFGQGLVRQAQTTPPP